MLRKQNESLQKAEEARQREEQRKQQARQEAEEARQCERAKKQQGGELKHRLKEVEKGMIFVGGLNAGYDDEAFVNTFGSYGNILSCKLFPAPDAWSEGYGFVCYETAEAAKEGRRLNRMPNSRKGARQTILEVHAGDNLQGERRDQRAEVLRAASSSLSAL